MSYRKPAIIITLIVAAFAVLLVNRAGSKEIVSPEVESQNLTVPTSTPTPTIPPIIIDQGTDLETEAGKLTPSDFSEDFTLLKEDAKKL